MKAGLLKSILLAYLIFSPFLLAGIEYYLLSALLATIVISLLEIKRVEKAIGEIAEFSGSITSGDFRKSLFLKGKGAIGELAKNINDLAQNFEMRLKEGEEEKYKIEAILMNMSDGLMLTDTKGRILLSNSAIKNFFGVESNIEGRTLMETLRKSELMEVIDRVVKTKETISLEIEVTHPRELYLVATAAPFSVKGGVSGVVLTFYDITGLKQLEDMRKDFVANVSHEIKTPITAIKGFAETLLEGAIDDKENTRKFLETIRTHSERLDSLVSDLLTLSGIELGDIKIQKMDVNLDNVVDTVFATLRGKAKNKGLYLKKEISPDLQEIKADRDRLIQILLNLVDNGIKFTEEGGVTVKVKVTPLCPPLVRGELRGGVFSEERDFIEISVEDTGIGIPRKHLSRLGERFYRVDRARSRELGGTGLGLAIVKHLVKAHGWEMEIESTQGGGTKVKIIILSVTRI
ncbi:MAG: two-component system histidine kinase PnpS [Nitrospirota bacterium]